MLHIVKGGDELKCHRHDFGHFVLFLVLTMLKNAFYLSNVPLDQQFVFFFYGKKQNLRDSETKVMYLS